MTKQSLKTRLLAVVGPAVFLTACATVGGPTLPEASLLENFSAYEAEQEVRLDATVPGFVPALGREPLSPRVLAAQDATTQGYEQLMPTLNAILDDVVRSGPRPDLRPQIALRATPTANATAPREDLIILTTGLISAVMCDETLERETECYPLSDDQRANALAFVIAHEYAHTLLGHPHQYQIRQDELRIADDLANAFSMVTTVASLAQSAGADVSEEYAEISQGFAAAAVATPVIEAELYRGMFAPYARQAESEADFLAFEILDRAAERAKVSYDGYAGADYLRTVFPAYNSVVSQRLTNALEASRERTQVYAQSFAAAAPAMMLDGQEENLMQSLRTTAMAEGLQLGLDLYLRFSRQDDVHIHHSGSARADAMAAYGERFNILRQLPNANPAAFNLTEAEYAEAQSARAERGAAVARGWEADRTAVLAAQRARELMALGDLAGARSELEDVPDGETSIEYLMVRGQLEMAEGQHLAASEWFLDATRAPEAPIGAWAGLAKGRFLRGQHERAFATLDDGEAAFGEDALLIERIEFLLETDEEAALAALERCESAYDDAPTQRRRCERLAPEPEAGPEEETTGPRSWLPGGLMGGDNR